MVETAYWRAKAELPSEGVSKKDLSICRYDWNWESQRVGVRLLFRRFAMMPKRVDSGGGGIITTFFVFFSRKAEFVGEGSPPHIAPVPERGGIGGFSGLGAVAAFGCGGRYDVVALCADDLCRADAIALCAQKRCIKVCGDVQRHQARWLEFAVHGRKRGRDEARREDK